MQAILQNLWGVTNGLHALDGNSAAFHHFTVADDSGCGAFSLSPSWRPQLVPHAFIAEAIHQTHSNYEPMTSQKNRFIGIWSLRHPQMDGLTYYFQQSSFEIGFIVLTVRSPYSQSLVTTCLGIKKTSCDWPALCGRGRRCVNWKQRCQR
jgi:hypothetical protein